MIDGDIEHSTTKLVVPSIIQQTLPVSAMPFLVVYSDKNKTGGLALSRPLYPSLSLSSTVNGYMRPFQQMLLYINCIMLHPKS